MNIEALQEIQARRMAIAKKKNHDYGGCVDAIAICGIQGLATRLFDKAARVLSLTQPGVKAQVTDESLKDTLMDMANYAEYGVSILEGTWEKKEPAPTPKINLAQRIETNLDGCRSHLDETSKKGVLSAKSADPEFRLIDGTSHTKRMMP